MGKAKKIKVSKSVPIVSNIPLADQIEDATTITRVKNRQKQRLRQEENNEFVDADLSRKILIQARQQQVELEDEESKSSQWPKKRIVKLGPATSDGSDDEHEQGEIDDYFEPSEDDHKYYGQIELDPEDEQALLMFQQPATNITPSFGDIVRKALERQQEIGNRISERRAELATQFSEAGDIKVADLDPRLTELYVACGEILSKYRSGKLPKGFKLIPTLKNWEQIVYLTEPQNWSAAAMYQATRIFASNLNEPMAQRFYNLILLPRIRDDLEEYKRLNFHLYQALKKSLFKPRAFNKGILLPLLNSGTCTLREAIIIGSVIAKNSIKREEAEAAILKIAEMPYTGANSIFLRILLDKKYALSYRVVDGVVYHFLRFEREKRELPVLWHQAFLTFVQRYKDVISTEQKEALLELLKKQKHPAITPEIRRELQHSKCLGAEYVDPMDF